MRTLATPRLMLAPQTVEHAEAMFAVLADPALYAYENEPPASLDWLRVRFERLASRRSIDGREEWLNWVAQLAEGRLIGFVQATVHDDRSAEIAYVFGSSHWGRGLASEAVTAMLEELAAGYGVSEFFAVLKRANERSSKLLERLGFEPADTAWSTRHPVDADERLMVRVRACFDGDDPGLDNARTPSPTIDLSPLRSALAQLTEALAFWHAQTDGAPLKRHLRSAVVQSFEFSYELSIRLMRRVLIERAASSERITDLSFNDLLRAAADAGLMPDAIRWREWRQMRSKTSHAYDEAIAEGVAQRAAAFGVDASTLLVALETSLAK